MFSPWRVYSNSALFYKFFRRKRRERMSRWRVSIWSNRSQQIAGFDQLKQNRISIDNNRGESLGTAPSLKTLSIAKK